MKNVAKGALFVCTIMIGLVLIESTITAKSSQAKYSKGNIQTGNLETQYYKQTIQEVGKKVVNTQKVEAIPIDVNVDSGEAGAEAGKRFRATAYCLRGRTATGSKVRRGIVAADPRILGLGTRIHMTGGSYTGHYLVADTGGKIKGRVLDIWVPSCAEARRWGSRSVTVKVVNKKRA